MALQNPGVPISLNDVNVELGNLGTVTITMNDTAVRALAGIASGPISMYDFYGKSSIPAESGYHVSESIIPDSKFVDFTIDSSNYTYSVSSHYTNYFTITKNNTNGAAVWAKRVTISGITNLNNLNAVSIKLDSTGNIYVIANALIGSNYFTQVTAGLIVKVNSAASSVIWCRSIEVLPAQTYAPKGWLLSSFDINSSNGDIYIAGVANNGSTPVYPHMLMAKLDSLGILQWNKVQFLTESSFGYHGLRPETYLHCKLDNSGNIYYSGTIYNARLHAALDSSGNFIWGPYKNVGSGNIAMDTANGQFYSFDGVYLYKTILSSGATTRIATLTFKNPFNATVSTSGNYYGGLRICNLTYNPSTGDLYYVYSGAGGATALANNFYFITKGNINNLNTLSWTKAFGANLASPALASAFPAVSYSDFTYGINMTANSGVQITSGGNLVMGCSGPQIYYATVNTCTGTVFKLPPDSTTINTLNANYGSYFTLDDPNTTYNSNTDTSTSTNVSVTNGTYLSSVNPDNGTYQGSPTATITTPTVTTTVTQFTSNTNRIVVAPPVGVTAHRTFYTANKKYHIVYSSNGSSVSNTSLNISTVPSGKTWNWLIVGSGAMGQSGNGDGGSGGNGGGGGQVITGSSSSAGNQTNITVGGFNVAASTSAFGSTALHGLNGGGGGGSAGSQGSDGGSTSNGTLSSIAGIQFAYGTGGGGGGGGSTVSGDGSSGGTTQYATYNAGFASRSLAIYTANSGGNGGGIGGNGTDGSWDSLYSYPHPMFAGHGGGGGGGGGGPDPESVSGSGGGQGSGTSGMVIVSYDYNP